MATPASPQRPASLGAVLGHAWETGPFTATDAMEATGLTRSTTIEAVDTLVAAGLLRELPNARAAGDYRKGRPARRFELREDAAVLVGVDAGSDHVSVQVTDLRSRALASVREQLPPDGAAPDRRAAIVASVDEALALAGASRAQVLSLGAAVAAPVDAHGRSPKHPDGFWERMNPDLVGAFSWAPIVHIDNDASLAAIAEGRIGAAVGCRDYVALLAGVRLGSGVVVDGALLRGRHGGVGEMVAFDHVVGVGSAEGLGTQAVDWVRRAQAAGEVPATSALATIAPEQLTGAAILELAVTGDAAAAAVADAVGLLLARIVSVLGSMFDPQLVVVSGDGSSAAIEHVVELARRALPTDLDLPAPDLVVSPLGANVILIGAVAAASGNARERALDEWERLADR